MPWRVEVEEHRARVVLTGLVDIFEAAPLHASLLDLARRKGEVAVDVSACSGLDSSALQLLLALREALEGNGGRCVLHAGDGSASRLLARVGLR